MEQLKRVVTEEKLFQIRNKRRSRTGFLSVNVAHERKEANIQYNKP